jgi:hypothetical protein
MKPISFTLSEVQLFGRLSGDQNPIHVDPIRARRSIFGRPVVHGVFLLMWAINIWSKRRRAPWRLVNLQVWFNQSVGLGEEVVWDLTLTNSQSVEIELKHNDVLVTRIKFNWARASERSTSSLPTTPSVSGLCHKHSERTIVTASGSLELSFDQQIAVQLFPHLCSSLTAHQIAVLLATTRLVGMECPGLHSVFSYLELLIEDNQTFKQHFLYSVENFDERLGLTTLRLTGEGLKGTIRAFLSPEPVEQLSYLDAKKVVQNGEFSSQSAIVIGGSRGLGEVATKLLVAGGADVIFTYFLGAKEAIEIKEEIIAGGGRVKTAPWNILEKDLSPDLCRESYAARNALYFFATPNAFLGNPFNFSTELFESYCQYYVQGFIAAFRLLLADDRGLIKIFFPSSVAVQETPSNMKEYATAKLVGENLCKLFGSQYENAHFHCPRLPKLSTDQASLLPSLIKIKADDIMLKEIRHLRDMT